MHAEFPYFYVLYFQIVLAETLVQSGNAGDHGTAGGTFNPPVLAFQVG